MWLTSSTGNPRKSARLSVLVAGLLLLVLLTILFRNSFKPAQVHFANDGPLGLVAAQAEHGWDNLLGYWQDLHWLGNEEPGASPNLTQTIFHLAASNPVTFEKIYAPLALFILGLSAWLFFQQMGFAPLVCILGGLAAALNMDFLSNACWGLPTRALTVAMVFLSMAALQSGSRNRPILKAILAGLAMGMGLMEGYDLAAILSLYLAAFGFFLTLNKEGLNQPRAILKGIGRVAVVAVFAAFMAAQALTTLVGTQVKGVTGMEQDEQTKGKHWGFATQWSLPKIETLRIIIPGLFGYRMDTPEGGNYWGTVGQDPNLPDLMPTVKNALADPREEVRSQAAAAVSGRMRFSGSGEYAGILVVLLAGWALIQSLRGPTSPLTLPERRMVWFWAGLSGLSLLFAFGRFAPFYQFVYALPYFSTIRSPIKFMCPFHLGLIILFAYGLQDISRRYLETASVKMNSAGGQLKASWSRSPSFDKKMTWCFIGLVGAGLLGWLGYASSRPALEAFIRDNFFSETYAAMISRFSIGEVGLFVLFLMLSCGIIILILGKIWVGQRAMWAGILLAIILVLDLARANLPWISYYDYKVRYAANPIINILKDHAYEHRVTAFPFQVNNAQANEALQMLQQFYQVEWLQYQFPYYNIQTLDMPQDPRPTQEKDNYLSALLPPTLRLRYWQLTNTRYILGLAGLVEPILNQQFDPELRRFKVHTTFTLQPEKADSQVIVQTNSAGPYALIEFTGALPRAGLFSNWQIVTNQQAALQLLTSTNFNPLRTVIVGDNLPVASTNIATNAAPGPVKYVSYAPKRLRLQAKAEAPSVLLLNDRFDPNWKVRIDGQPSNLLRCNYMVRGVFLSPGQHEVDFYFQPSALSFYVSLAALVVGILLLLLLILTAGAAYTETEGTQPQDDTMPGAKIRNNTVSLTGQKSKANPTPSV